MNNAWTEEAALEAYAIDAYVVTVTPAQAWAVLQELERHEEIGGSALRLALKIRHYHRFSRIMTFLREMGAVGCRRPQEPGECGESRTTNSPWVYRMNDVGRALLRSRARVIERHRRGEA